MTRKKGASEPARRGSMGEEAVGSAAAVADASLIVRLPLVNPPKSFAGESLFGSFREDRLLETLDEMLVRRILGNAEGLGCHRALQAMNANGIQRVGRAGGVAQIGNGGIERTGPHLID